MDARRAKARAFVYRGGVRLAGTVVACDAAVGGDLVFLSHAAAVVRGSRARLGVGRRQLLATDVTLALLAAAGAHQRGRALVAAYGRPFVLGNLRLELFPSGLMPGAASLLCEEGGRRLVYAGPIGAEHAEVRAAEALCLDATFARRGIAFPTRAAALALVGALVRRALADGAAPVLLIDPIGVALEVGQALAADRVGLRGHREVVQAAAAHRCAGLPAPAIQRFAGQIGAGEVLLWPGQARLPARRRGGRPLRLILVGPEANSAVAAGFCEDATDAVGVTFPVGADFSALIAYVQATGATEVALVNAPGDDLRADLAARGIDAYCLGPPQQELLRWAGVYPDAIAG